MSTIDSQHVTGGSSSVLLAYLPYIVSALMLINTLVTFIIRPFFQDPLRHIPRAHWSVPIPYLGHLWILLKRSQSQNNQTTYLVHRDLGPVVRLSPSEISVNCYEGGLKTIYAGGYEKHEWYPRQFTNFGVMNMFSTVGHAPHAAKKRIMANIYSKSYLANSEQVRANSRVLLEERILPLLESLTVERSSGEDVTRNREKQGDVSDGGVEVHELNNAFTMDFMTAFQFGIANSTNFIQDQAVRRKYLELYHSRREWQFISSEIPPAIRKALKLVGISLFPEWIHAANEWLEDWSRSMCDAADGYLKRISGGSASGEGEATKEPGNEPLVFKQYKTGLFASRSKDPMSGVEVHPHLDEGMNFRGLKTEKSVVPDQDTTLLEVYSDMVDQLAAGHETSAVALTYLYHELSRHPEMQDQLHEEIIHSLGPTDLEWAFKGRSSFTSNDQQIFHIPTPKDIDLLPFLNALVQETLRLHAPIPGMQPRITPNIPGGTSLGPPDSNSKHHYTNIPGNIRVSAMPYTLHRIPDVFPNPESFIPNRWLPKSQSSTQSQSQSPDPFNGSTDTQLLSMNRHFWAFGSGGRMCIGRHFALQEIKLIVCAIYRNWRTEIVDDDGIEELDAYTTRPRSGRLVLRFVRR